MQRTKNCWNHQHGNGLNATLKEMKNFKICGNNKPDAFVNIKAAMTSQNIDAHIDLRNKFGLWYDSEKEDPINYSLSISRDKYTGGEDPNKINFSCASFCAWVSARYFSFSVGEPERISFQGRTITGLDFEKLEIPSVDMRTYTPSSIFRGSIAEPRLEDKYRGNYNVINGHKKSDFYIPTVDKMSAYKIRDTTPEE